MLALTHQRVVPMEALKKGFGGKNSLSFIFPSESMYSEYLKGIRVLISVDLFGCSKMQNRISARRFYWLKAMRDNPLVKVKSLLRA